MKAKLKMQVQCISDQINSLSGTHGGAPTRPKGTQFFLWDSNPESRTLTQPELGSQTLILSTVSLVSDHASLW